MRKKRQSKILAIIALCISVLGLTLGFAAFSNTLTISSSATVSPDSSDFKLVMYGLPNKITDRSLDITSPQYRDVNAYTSTTTAGPSLRGLTSDAEFAVIDNENFSLKNIKASFKNPGDGAVYFVVLKNEGKYDAYIDVANISIPSHICEAGSGTTKELVDKACESMTFSINLGHYDNGTGMIDWDVSKYLDENGNVKVPVNSYVYFHVHVYYMSGSDARADGDFSVTWDNLEINFSTVSQ